MRNSTWWGARSGAVLTAVALMAAGCTDEITGSAEQVGGRSPNFELAPAAARGMPSGTGAILGYDVNVNTSGLAPNAFQRGGTSGASIGHTGCANLFSATAPCWNFNSWMRDSAGDPRGPAMKRVPGMVFTFAQVGGPQTFGASLPMFEWYVRINGLTASSPYFMSLVRYGVIVRGMQDQIERLAYGTITEPDSLVVMNPNPGGYPATNYNWTTNAACVNLLVPPGTNPLYLGPTNSTSGRQVTLDKCFGSGTNQYYRAATLKVDSSPIVKNNLTAATIPITNQYNYIVISEGSTPGGPVIARAQIGQDLDAATGNPLPNGLAPFPLTNLSPGTLIGVLKIAEGGPNAVRLRVLPLEPLEGTDLYAITLVNRETGVSQQVNASYYTVTTDTTGRDDLGNVITTVTTSATTTVNAIPGAAPNVAHVIEVRNSQNPGTQVRSFTDLALKPPSATSGVPIWSRFLQQSGTPTASTDDVFFDASTVTFGTMYLTPNAAPYIFRISGFGDGTNRGDEIGIAFQHLPRPPIGYYYNVWLVPATGAPLSIGEITTPLPSQESLHDADIAGQIGNVLTPTEILRASKLLRPADIAGLGVDVREYTTIRLTLESKDGTPTVAPIVVLEGALIHPEP